MSGEGMRRSSLLDEVIAAQEDYRRAQRALDAFDAAERERRCAVQRLRALFERDWHVELSANALRDLERNTP